MNKYFAAFASFLIFETTCPGQEIPALPAFPDVPATTNERTVEPTISISPSLSTSTNTPFVGQIKGDWPPTFGNSKANADSTLASTVSIPAVAPSQPSIDLPSLPDLSSSVPAPAVPVVAANNAPPVPSVPPVSNTPAAPIASEVPAPVSAPAVQAAPVAAPVAQQIQAAPQKPAVRPVALAVDINSQICPLKIRQAHPGEHPMGPLLEWAVAGKKIYLSKIQDYTCTMVKKERLGKTVEPNRIFMKVREQPFSVYLRFEEPKARCGQEVLFVSGQNNDKLLGHDVGIKKYLGSMWLVPDGTIAMMGQRYPVTDSGIANLVKKMIETMRADMKYGECDVRFTLDGPQIEGRPCVRIDVIHPVKRDCFRFHKAEIFLDKQLGVPLQYSAYLWPENEGEDPILDEEYSFSNLKFNVGLTDKDFDRENKEYQF